ncbi:MAG TPA: hypothetical protein VJ550_14995 [Geomonas sp.]|nr:hypothetical protein [Geomonas sp.]
MFDWLWNKNRKVLEFADNEAAFQHACSIGYKPLIDALIPALVEEEGALGRDGERTFLIRLAGAPGRGPVTLWSCTLKESPQYPKPGDFVGFRIVTIASDLPEQYSLIGYLACRLEPVLVEGKGWRVAQSYTPGNIKRALRL